MRPELAVEITLRPAFHDIDPMDVVWHGHYLKYFELARCALLKRFNFDYPQMRESGFVWPVVDLRVKYVRPARFDQPLRVHAQIVEWEHRLVIDYVILDAVCGEVVTRGHSTQVAVSASTGELCLISPPILIERLGVGLS
ncbi:MAG: 4-hydroxybenzoyl-CoA thioesterase [Lysobacterales bacterium CG17_big_fil_post_rev_8_21_14_2_50_64_11]|nr:MAG: 4-hydroxybenzoyl-CoA thioesterase [Xanthomonadales bacterium CG17_big_fil_post_rev_8_21_14_2_50_64_11]